MASKYFIRGGFSPFQLNGLGDDPYSNVAADSTGTVTIPLSVLNTITTPVVSPASSLTSGFTINPLYVLGGLLFMGVFLSGAGKR